VGGCVNGGASFLLSSCLSVSLMLGFTGYQVLMHRENKLRAFTVQYHSN
jgi:hypothetical protein